jgi:hypothetical protein
MVSKAAATPRVKITKKQADAIDKALGPSFRRYGVARAALSGAAQISLDETSGAHVPQILGALSEAGVPLVELGLWYPPGAAIGTGTEQGAERVLGSALDTPLLASLTKLALVLSRVPLSATAMRCLAAAMKHARALRSFSIAAAAAAPLDDWALSLPPLEALSITGLAPGDEGAKILAAAPGLAALRRLALAHQRITGAGLAALLAAPWMSTLEALSLGHEPALDEAAFAAIASLEAPALVELSLGNLALPAARALAASSFASTLRVLKLTGAGLDDAAITVLAERGFPALEQLDVANNAISVKALDPLIQGSPKLRELTLPVSLRVPKSWVKRGRVIL